MAEAIFHDLIYCPKEVEEVIKKRYPNAKITDASDAIHIERFECRIEGVGKDEFYPFAIREGFAGCCLGFNIALQSLRFPEPKGHPGEHKETEDKIKTWIESSKKGG